MKLTSALVLSLLFLAGLADSTQFSYKNLQGDPSEFSTFTMPKSQDTAMFTSAAMLPIKFSTSRTMFQTTFYVDSSVEFGFCAISPLAEEFDYSFQLPSNDHTFLLTELLEKFNGSYFKENIAGGQAAIYPAECFRFMEPVVGAWKIIVTLTKGDLKHKNNAVPQSDDTVGSFLVFNDSPLKLRAYNSYGVVKGDKVQIHSEIYSNDHRLTFPNVQSPVIAQTVVINPTGGQVLVDLADDGLHGDGGAGDGLYGGHFSMNDTGVYQMTTYMSSTTPQGVQFQRSADHVLRVIHSKVDLQDTAKGHVEGDYLKIKLRVKGVQHNTDELIAYSQVWGKDSTGKNDIPIAWVSGISERQKNAEEEGTDHYELLLHLNWIEKSGALEPFSLKEIRVQDREILVVLGEIDHIDIHMKNSLPKHRIASAHHVITHEMRNGPRPQHLQQQNEATAGKKILLHGYCSDGFAWPLSNFTDALLFQDPNANRKIDEFARLVLAFANSSGVDSYSFIAHSQGGLVSLHIATYYWSGLDVATGGNLIQSVGSPYHGTTMAGTLASIGQWFGLGCGANDDLTPEGAATWLAGIPQEKQSLVHFYTTDGTSACSTPSNWLGLATPNDGVVAKAYGFLEYGNNEGNYDGWCHTVGMTSPFQCTDVDRNAILNADAAL